MASPGATLQVAASGGGWEAASPEGVVGWAGPLEADAPPWAGPLFGFEVRLAPRAGQLTQYVPVPVTPAVERDLALVLPAGVSAAAVTERLRRAAGPLLERLEVFDEYRGDKVPAGTRSVAWHCSFRDPARTLAQAEVDRLVTAALRALEDELGVRRRET